MDLKNDEMDLDLDLDFDTDLDPESREATEAALDDKPAAGGLLSPGIPGVLAQEHSVNWTFYNGDSCEVIRSIPDNSVGFSVYSPPFASLYVYSDSERDLGNSRSEAEFFEHYRFLIAEKLRITKPGRLSSVHCMNLPTTIQRDGVIGISDFRGEIIRQHVAAGWIFHSEVVIWKDPVTAMQRTNALGLLHMQIKKDSCMSRMGIPDYVVTFRKPGQNAEPVEGELEYFIGDQSTFRQLGNLSIDIWRRYASPVWMDVDMSRTLNYRAGREESDERHIAPLQLDVIERCLELWSNPGDVVWSPFGGVASEGYCAVKAGRKSIACELKPSYWRMGCKNLRAADEECKARKLF